MMSLISSSLLALADSTAASSEPWPQPGQIVLIALAVAGVLVLFATRPRLALQILSWAFAILRGGGPGRPRGHGFSGGRSGGAGASGAW